MPRDPSDASRDPENKRSSGSDKRSSSASSRAARAAAWGGQRRGRSGYGMESIRPHLRAQLEQQKLMRPTFPPEADDDKQFDDED